MGDTDGREMMIIIYKETDQYIRQRHIRTPEDILTRSPYLFRHRKKQFIMQETTSSATNNKNSVCNMI